MLLWSLNLGFAASGITGGAVVPSPTASRFRSSFKMTDHYLFLIAMATAAWFLV